MVSLRERLPLFKSLKVLDVRYYLEYKPTPHWKDDVEHSEVLGLAQDLGLVLEFHQQYAGF